jgi:hypothetical protein
MWEAVSTDGGKTFPRPQKLGTWSWPLKGALMPRVNRAQVKLQPRVQVAFIR